MSSQTEEWEIPNIAFEGGGSSLGLGHPLPHTTVPPSAAWQRSPKRQRHRLRTAAEVASHFPITLALVVQYVPLVLVPVTYDGNPFPAFVVKLTLTALAMVFAVELLLYRFRPNWGEVRRISVHRAGLIALVGCLADLLAVHLGKSYGYGAALKQASPLLSVVSPFRYWPAAGVLLAMYSYRRQPGTRRWVWLYTVVTIAILLTVGLLSSQIGEVMYPSLLVMGVGAVLTGTVRMRTIMICVVGAVVIWPVLYHIRNEGRIAEGATSYAYASPNAASHRIEFDQLMANAYLAKEAEVRLVGLPTWPEVAVDAIVPRFLDEGRPPLDTSALINVATGGNGKGAETFTTIGEVWFLYGWKGLVLIQGVVALAGALLIRHRSPTAFVLLGAVIFELLQAESGLPDALAGCIQAAIAAVAAILLLRPVRGAVSSRRGSL